MTRLFEISESILIEKVKKLKNPSEFTFVYMGGSWAGDGESSNSILIEAFKEAQKHNPLFILHGGDAVFSGTREQILIGRDYVTETGTKHIQSFLELVDQYLINPDPKITKNEIPLFVIPGNHDQDRQNGSLNNFTKYIGPVDFKLSNSRLKVSIIGVKNFFYVKKNGQIQMEYGFSINQLDTLHELLKDTHKYTFLGMHAPPRAGKWADPNYFPERESTFTTGLSSFLEAVKGKVSRVLVSHIHAYDQTIIQGIPYILSGGTGAPLVKYGFLSSKSKVAKEIFHIIVIKVKNGKITHRAIPVGWTA